MITTSINITSIIIKMQVGPFRNGGVQEKTTEGTYELGFDRGVGVCWVADGQKVFSS